MVSDLHERRRLVRVLVTTIVESSGTSPGADD
jgi:hypothetical protein